MLLAVPEPFTRIFVDFLFQQFLQKSRSNSSENCIHSGLIRLWWKVGAVVHDVTRGTISIAQYVSSVKNGEKVAIVSGEGSDSGDLGLP